ncbi:MAG TPA: hypothetical protein PLQ45_00060 [Anaerohalosphaeraceae bacterium]|nr:hypothetical protein [Anaerohalosphaeraceae bacterium]
MMFKQILDFLDYNRFTVVCPVVGAVLWIAAVGCTPVTQSPIDEARMVNARQLQVEYQVWLAEQKVMEARFEAAGQDLTEQAQANEKITQTLVSLASGSVADWGGLVQLLVGGGLLGAIGDNIRKNGVIGGLKRGIRGSSPV